MKNGRIRISVCDKREIERQQKRKKEREKEKKERETDLVREWWRNRGRENGRDREEDIMVEKERKR